MSYGIECDWENVPDVLTRIEKTATPIPKVPIVPDEKIVPEKKSVQANFVAAFRSIKRFFPPI